MKQPWESKIFWINIVATIAAVLDIVKVLDLPANYIAIGAVVVAVLNVVIRIWFTDTAIWSKQQ